jgi:hypothetical protein
MVPSDSIIALAIEIAFKFTLFVNDFFAHPSKGQKRKEGRVTMKTNTIKTALLMSILSLIWGTNALAGERYTERPQQRMDRQSQRIESGIRSGEITGSEFRHLHKDQRRIGRAYNRGRSDGHLSRQERHRIDKMQDRASRHIYRSKHNHANRYERHLSRRHHRYRHPSYHHRPKAHKHGHHRHRGPYPLRIGSDVGYLLAGSFSEPGWTLSFSMGSAW